MTSHITLHEAMQQIGQRRKLQVSAWVQRGWGNARVTRTCDATQKNHHCLQMDLNFKQSTSTHRGEGKKDKCGWLTKIHGRDYCCD
mmetsp:Transcript_1023/g.3430  ORF Transcript_1023/g.3430 Transcript_1023/m.3430 type:complete len:86 (+) Transcript_1023:129-386(+)|eukprot:scaffold128343_cov30-Tisochrysis_lutea.AAC.1